MIKFDGFGGAHLAKMAIKTDFPEAKEAFEKHDVTPYTPAFLVVIHDAGRIVGIREGVVCSGVKGWGRCDREWSSEHGRECCVHELAYLNVQGGSDGSRV